jgi:hypothetical protein
MTRLHALLAAAALVAATSSSSWAQSGDGGTPPKAGKPDKAAKAARAPRPPTRFFDSEEPIAVTLAANFGQLRRDRGAKAPWRPARISYAGPDGAPVDVPLRVRTRGIWRLKNCSFPPLRLNFGEPARNSPFDRLDKPKLVSYCRDNDTYEQYVLQELQLYRIHALLTPVSHKTRLLHATYVDSASGKRQSARYAFVLEEPDALAARLGGTVLDAKGAKAEDLDPYHAALVGVFQYLIGNSDWSVAALHNAELVRDSAFSVHLVPYDFDFAGAVNTPYAVADPKLNLPNVRQRLYRGHCAPEEDYARVLALFAEKKSAIYALYSREDPVGRLLRPQVAKETLSYFDDFYRTIGNSRRAKAEIVDACVRQQ